MITFVLSKSQSVWCSAIHEVQELLANYCSPTWMMDNQNIITTTFHLLYHEKNSYVVNSVHMK